MTTPHHRRRRRRRFFRYSLRTLMLVITVFCVWMGITAKRARDQRLAVEAVLAIGGTVTYEHGEFRHGVTQSPQSLRWGPGPPPRPPGPEWLRRIIGDDYFFSVDSVSISGRATSDAVLVHLKGLSDLEFLALVNARITDAGLVHLKGLTNLTTLALSGTQITDAGLEHLKGLTKLTELDLTSTEVSDKGIKKLKQWFPNCQIYYLDTDGSVFMYNS